MTSGSLKRYYEKNKERIKARNKKYAEKNKERIYAQRSKRYHYIQDRLKEWMPERVNKAGTFAGTHENCEKNLKGYKEKQNGET